MARNRLPQGEKKGILTIYIEEKYLLNQDKEALRKTAYDAIINQQKIEKL